MFMRYKSAEVRWANPDMAQKDVMRKVAGLWKELTVSEKWKYQMLADADCPRVDALRRNWWAYNPSDAEKA